MSLTGKGALSIKKQDVQEQNTPALGFKKIRVLHEASAGDENIDLTAPNAPADASTYVEPSLSDRTSTNLLQFKENVTVKSTVRPTMLADLDYTINGAYKIRLTEPALEGEIFEIIIDHNPRTGNTIVDAQPLVSTGTLSAGATDFNVGTPFEVGKFPGQQHGAVMVMVDGQLMYRNTGNNPPGPGVDGDYYEVPAGAGLAVVIRFNNADLIKDRNVSVISVGALAEQPNGSFLALIEALQGQIDAMVPTLAQLAGVPETDFQATPNDVDLKAFGDRVFAVEEKDVEQDERLDALETPGTYQEVTLTSLVETSLADTWEDVSELTLVLTPGVWDIGYELAGQIENESGASNVVLGGARLADGSGNSVSNTVSYASARLAASGGVTDFISGTQARSQRIAVNSTTSYKVQIRCNQAVGTAKFVVIDETITGTLTDPDAHSKIWARKVAEV